MKTQEVLEMVAGMCECSNLNRHHWYVYYLTSTYKSSLPPRHCSGHFQTRCCLPVSELANGRARKGARHRAPGSWLLATLCTFQRPFLLGP